MGNFYSLFALRDRDGDSTEKVEKRELIRNIRNYEYEVVLYEILRRLIRRWSGGGCVAVYKRFLKRRYSPVVEANPLVYTGPPWCIM